MSKKPVKLFVIAALACLTIGCTTTRYTGADFTIPPTPNPPELVADDLSCLPDSTYRAVIERDRQLTDWGLEMRAILRTLQAD